jgi:choline-sulfatase
MNVRPNILFLMSDEHRADVAGFAGNSVVRTPVLDRLAATGTVFRNAYTPSPICVPGRMCLMSGQLPRTCGCEGPVDLAPNSRTFAREFARYAYHTVCSGKLHHLGTDQMQGWTRRIAPDAEIADWNVPDRIPGEFERYPAPLGTGKWTHEREINEARAAEGPYQIFDARAVQASLDFFDRYFEDALYRRPQAHRPLLFKLSLVQPHYPFFTDAERFEHYLPRVPVYRDKPCEHPVLSLSQQGTRVSVSEEAARRATAAYYGMIDQVDAYFGNILEKLDALGQNLDDWIVVYTTDHGEMLGQHGLWEKGRFYEASVRVPLIIRWPTRFPGGRVVNENVSLCDLFATLCDLADIPIPPGLDSRSLVPLLSGNPSKWSNESIAQYERDHVMIKRNSLKYQYYGAEIPEVLFDLACDPGETHNLAAHPAFRTQLAAFHKRLAQLGHQPPSSPSGDQDSSCQI